MSWNFGTLNPWQKKVLRQMTLTQFTVVAAGRRSGKTFLIKTLIHLVGLSKPNSRIAIVYPSLKHGKSVLFNELCDDYYRHKSYYASKGGLYKPTMEFKYHNNSTVKFFSLERPDDMRGEEFDLVILDECQELRNSQDVIDSIIDPTLTPIIHPITKKPINNRTAGKCLMFGTSKGRNDFYNLVKKGKDPEVTNWHSFIIPSIPANCPHIPEEYLIQKKLDMNPLAFEREFLCSFESYEGLVYSEFNRDIHMIPSLAHIHDMKVANGIIGLDFGYSPHPLGLVVVMKSNHTKPEYVIVEEVKKQKLTVTDDSLIAILKTLIERYQVTHIYCSPEENHNRKVLQDKLQNVIIKPGNNKVADGISYVRNCLHYNFDSIDHMVNPKLRVIGTCSDTIKELETYSYKDNSEEPVKLNDDLVDAIRYALYTDSQTISTTFSNNAYYY